MFLTTIRTGECRMPGNPARMHVRILLVEDSPDDAYLMEEALKASNLSLAVTTVEDGEEAIDYLFGNGTYAGSPRPDLILLDLHLPRKDGHEVLVELKGDRLLRRIPVIILTSSDNEKDFLKAYDLHANCCVCKPTDQQEFADTVKKIEHFWLHVAQHLPAPGPS